MTPRRVVLGFVVVFVVSFGLFAVYKAPQVATGHITDIKASHGKEESKTLK